MVPKKGTYTIEVTDKTGNKTTLNKITVNWEKVKNEYDVPKDPTKIIDGEDGTVGYNSKVYTGQTLKYSLDKKLVNISNRKWFM